VSLRTRIAAAAGLAVAVTVIVAAGFVYVAVRSQLRGEVDDALRDRAMPVSRRLDPNGPGRPPRGDREGRDAGPGIGAGRPPFFGPEPPPRFGGAEGFVQFVTPAGRAIRPRGETGELPVSDEARDIARAGAGESLTDADVDGTHLRVLTVGVPGRGAVQVARPLAEVDSVLRRVLVALAVMVVLGIAIAAALGAWVARIALRPIGRFTQRTEALTANPDLGQRMEVEGSDELARLAGSFNTTLDALERSVEAQRHLVADASHELRTPIASLRANIQTLEDADRLPPEERASLRADIVSELDELTALVSDVVELARGSKPGDAADDVRLDLIVTSIAERARRRAAGDLTIAVDVEPTMVVGDPERIGRAVSNVLDNAVKYSPPGSEIEVRLAGGALTVRDHGQGFDEDDLAHVFERFYRSDNARAMPGSGLGLSIVRQAAEAHGGTAEVSNAPGGGAIVRVSFGAPVPSSVPLTGS
jgi:two-component system, OmpR family, sensor histidine kinase MprB